MKEQKLDETTKLKYLKNVVNIYCGGYHSFFLTRNGDIYCCGYNEYNQLCLGIKFDQHYPLKMNLKFYS